MLINLLLFAVDEAANSGQKPEGAPIWGTLLPLLPILVIFYFLMIRPMRRQEQERQKLISGIKKNDEVLTSSGIIATFISASDTDDEVVLRIDDSTRVRMLKSSIVTNLTAQKEAKAQKDQQK
jgi:preprotein translocase subunit YajC